MDFKDKAARFTATGGYVGYIPLAPGTAGSLLGLPICFFLSLVELPYAVLLTVLMILFAVWAAHETEKALESKDPGCIVIDEIAGMAVTLLGLPFTVKTAVLGFVVFRFLDILKPQPIRYLDTRISGGKGVVLDDVAAGIMGNLALRLVFFITGS